MNNKIRETVEIMSRINRKLFSAKEKESETQMGRGQMNILREIVNNENISQDELALKLNLDKTTVAKAAKKLESKGLIIRNPSKEDKRKKELVATDKAIGIKNIMKNHFDNVSISLFEGISESEIDAFKLTLLKIEKNIEYSRSNKIEKKDKVFKIIKTVKRNENISRKKLAKKLEMDIEKVNKVIDQLIESKIIEEKSDCLIVVEKKSDDSNQKINSDINFSNEIKNQKNKTELINKESREGKKVIYKLLSKKGGSSKDELIEKSILDEDVVTELLNRLDRSGLLEKIEDNYHIDKDKISKSKKRHKCKK